jgi:membrane-associated phospholipid phosphatase
MSIARRVALLLLAACLLGVCSAEAQTEPQLAVLKGLAPMSTLPGSAAGKAALVANLSVTAAIQDGTANQPMLLPLAAQRQQALRDAFTTAGNASDLADGLGSTLEPVYHAAARYSSDDGGKTSSFTNLSPAVAQVLAYAFGTALADSGLAKFFFASGTQDGRTPASVEALAIFTQTGGSRDVYGKTYGEGPGADSAGNPRPFLTRRSYSHYDGTDFFGQPTSNSAYLSGPADDLRDSPSFPSGHSTYGYTEALVLALLVPQRYPQLVARAAEYGNDRIIVGAHYAMDVLGGRALAEHDLAQLLAGTPGYLGVRRHSLVIDDFRAALTGARTDVDKALAEGCGSPVSSCALQDVGRFADARRTAAFYESTQTYGLPAVFDQNAHRREDVGRLAPEAGHLLTAAFPYLTLEQADAILTDTEGPGGGFLDDGSAFGVYSRLDLYRAAKAAMAAAPRPVAGR